MKRGITDWLRRLRGTAALDLGSRGEREAARFLRQRGYKILHRNLRLGDDEADLVALAPDDSTLVVIEVKTRRDGLIRPEEHVNRTKQHRLARLAARLMKQQRYRAAPLRFDVIAIVWPDDGEPQIRHFENAFQSPW